MKNSIKLLIAIILIVGGIFYIQSFSSQPIIQLPSQNLNTGTTSISTPDAKAMKYQKAPELKGIAGYINTDNISIASLKGKVVIVDFWTYSCINCIRTIPYLNDWYAKYKDQGLVIVGVHTPEFGFEKIYDNVKMAVEKFGIKYPVVQDNDYQTWNAYRNSYWPRKYIIDADGYIRFDHIGEGGYEETEKVIQSLLEERMNEMKINSTVSTNISTPNNVIPVDFYQQITPELYLGYGKSQTQIGNIEIRIPDKETNFTLPSFINSNVPSLGGTWKDSSEYIELTSASGVVELKYSAKAVNIVAGGNSTLHLQLDGKDLTLGNKGWDVNLINSQSYSTINDTRLYNLVFDDNYYTKTLKIEVNGTGFKLYTFTFG